MQWTERFRHIKIALVVSALLIAGLSLVVSHGLVADLEQEERHKMNIWAQAMRSIASADENTDLTLPLQVLGDNHTIPVIVLDGYGEVMEWRNLDRVPTVKSDSLKAVADAANAMKRAGHSIRVMLNGRDDVKNAAPEEFIEVCYDESLMLKRLAAYPYVQLGVVALFAVVAVIALLSSKRAEQNKVWVGLSRETAHQLGTPISSLMAWSEILHENHPDDELLSEMDKDVRRLQLIAERFSKIGSKPELVPTDVGSVVKGAAEYMSRRAPAGVSLTFEVPDMTVEAPLCAPLFAWVIENLCKNAIDAMPQGSGRIKLRLYPPAGNSVCLDVSDTGKGIGKKNFKTVFRPGYTTKKRGWGLGLSLAKRIVEEYHGGSIYVKESELGKGTTFRIKIPLT